MTPSTRAPFAPITPDIDDDKLERLAAEKGVGALVKPGAHRAGIETHASSGKPGTERPSDAVAAPRTEITSLNLELPTYVWTELKIRAVQKKTSLKHVVMTALLHDGVTIRGADMIEDGRRLRGSNSAG
jgi:hypothetical protein